MSVSPRQPGLLVPVTALVWQRTPRDRGTHPRSDPWVPGARTFLFLLQCHFKAHMFHPLYLSWCKMRAAWILGVSWVGIKCVLKILESPAVCILVLYLAFSARLPVPHVMKRHSRDSRFPKVWRAPHLGET